MAASSAWFRLNCGAAAIPDIASFADPNPNKEQGSFFQEQCLALLCLFVSEMQDLRIF